MSILEVAIWIVFVLGVLGAYPGAAIFPLMSPNRGVAFYLLILSTSSGWVFILNVALWHGNGQAWVKMPASWFFGLILFAAGAIIAYCKPPEVDP